MALGNGKDLAGRIVDKALGVPDPSSAETVVDPHPPWADPGTLHSDAHEEVPGRAAVNGRVDKATREREIRARLARVESCSHDELLAADLPPLRWIVAGLVPDEGLTFLGGRKKLGKSWLCLQIAQAVSLGAFCLERDTAQGKVVYLCLEDGRRRLRSRLEKQKSPGKLPISYYTRFPPLDGDGTGLFLDMLDTARPKLVILDTLAAAKTGKIDENAAGPLADIANFLRGVAQFYQCGILVTHHHGKAVTGDPGSDLRGTSALGGAADVNLGLYREEGQYLLRGEGRDIQEFSFVMKFDPVDTWCWQIVEEQRREGGDRQAEQDVLDALAEMGKASLAALADFTGKGYDAVRRIIRRLRDRGVLSFREERSGPGAGRSQVVYSLSRNGDSEG